MTRTHRLRRMQRLLAVVWCWSLGASALEAQRSAAPRIVTLGGAITETVFALGRGSQVVGVDASSKYPASVQCLPNVGYFRLAGAEGIMALRPSLVIADTGSAPATVAQLRSAGVQVVLLPAGETSAIAVERIERIGRLLGVPRFADSLAVQVRSQVARAEANAAGRATRPKVLFIYARGMGTLFVAGRATGADEMIRMTGGDNVGRVFEGYKPLTAEAVVTSGADVIVVPAQGLESLGGVDGLLRLPGLAQTPAGRARRVVTMPDDLLLGFGPRLPLAIETLTQKLHGETSATAPARKVARE